MSTKLVNIYLIPDLSPEEKNAVKAVWAGEANPGQQRMAMNAVVDKFSMADFLPYQSNSFSDTSFLNGRIFVGKAIRRVLKLEQE